MLIIYIKATLIKINRYSIVDTKASVALKMPWLSSTVSIVVVDYLFLAFFLVVHVFSLSITLI